MWQLKGNIYIFSILLLAIISITNGFNINSRYVAGDESNHILQALSIAYDADLKFDESDAQHWGDLGWKDSPRGLFFQKYSEGIAFAKPYGYSLFLAFFILIFGKFGFIIGNITLLSLSCLLIYKSLREHYDSLETTLLTTAIIFFSYFYLYTYYIHPDLFLAFLTSLFVYLFQRTLKREKKIDLFLLASVSAFMVSEKISLILIILPLAIYLIIIIKQKKYLVIYALSFFIVLLISVMPYLIYSDYKAWNPYSGDRYNNRIGTLPITFNEEHNASGIKLFKKNGLYYLYNSSFRKVDTKKHFSASSIIEKVNAEPEKYLVSNLAYYIYGSFTGILIFMPIAVIILFTSLFSICRERNWLLISTLSGVAAYIMFYIILFPTNYYGGGQSLGNRYFLQISPIIVLMLFALQLTKRQVYIVTIASGIASAMFLYHHHLSGKDAYLNIFHMSYLQSLMPTEITQHRVKAYSRNNPINLKLYPSIYKYIKGEIVNIDSEIIAITHNKKGKEKYNKIYLNGEAIYVNGRFYESEGSQVWSKSSSIALIENRGATKHFSVTPFKAGTTIKILIENEVIEGVAPYSFSINTSNYKSDIIKMKFLANKSGRPSDDGSSTDDRQLAFYLTRGLNKNMPFISYSNILTNYKKNNYIKLNDAIKVFNKSHFNNGSEVITNGFHDQEGSHIWSDRISSLLLRNNNPNKYYLVQSFVPHNKISVDSEEKNIHSVAPFVISITDNGNKEWVKLDFEATLSAKPCSLPTSNDCRLLSFMVSPIDEEKLIEYSGIPKYKF